MKFGIFYELQLPRPWKPDDERLLFNNALDQMELADNLVKRQNRTGSGAIKNYC